MKNKFKSIFYIFALTVFYCSNKKNEVKGSKKSDKKPCLFCPKKNKSGVLNGKTSFFDSLADFFSSGCKVPEGITPVKNFDKKKYLGTWYEIARLDHHFERGMSGITANYSIPNESNPLEVPNQQQNNKKVNDNEPIKVKNRGIRKNGKEKIINGKAIFAEKNQNIGHLKVSFWEPFYGSYVIFYLEDDENKNQYSIALVCGSSRKFLWILARKPQISKEKLNQLVKLLKDKGFDTNNLIYQWNNKL